MSAQDELKKELVYLGLFDKAKEIYYELGEKSLISYIESSHRLLSKVYHPDLNPENAEKAKITQQSLNRISQLVSRLNNEDIVSLFKKTAKKKERRKRKILVVEDEFGLQEIFRDIFLMEGYDVRVAIDGIDGYESFKKFMPDLVFTDVVMPKMSGLELVQKIREINPKIKVIYISGFFGIKKLKQQLDEDIIKYKYPTLAKPFKTSAMLELVKDYLDESG